MPTSNEDEYDDNEFVDTDEDGQEEEEQPQRQQANPLRKTVKQLQKELKALRQENETLKASTRSRSIADVFADKGVPEGKRAGLANFYPKDADSSAEAVAKWLDENAELFGLNLGADDGDDVDESTEQLQRVQQTAQRAKGQPTDLASIRTAMQNAKTPEEFQQLMGQLGNA